MVMTSILTIISIVMFVCIIIIIIAGGGSLPGREIDGVRARSEANNI